MTGLLSNFITFSIIFAALSQFVFNFFFQLAWPSNFLLLFVFVSYFFNGCGVEFLTSIYLLSFIVFYLKGYLFFISFIFSSSQLVYLRSASLCVDLPAAPLVCKNIWWVWNFFKFIYLFFTYHYQTS